MLERLRSEMDLRLLSIICKLLRSPHKISGIAAESKKVTVFWASRSGLRNETKFIIPCISKLFFFCSSSRHNFKKKIYSGVREGPEEVKRERARKRGPYIECFTQGKVCGGKNGPSLWNPKLHNGCKEEEVEHYTSVIRNGICFMEYRRFENLWPEKK